MEISVFVSRREDVAMTLAMTAWIRRILTNIPYVRDGRGYLCNHGVPCFKNVLHMSRGEKAMNKCCDMRLGIHCCSVQAHQGLRG